ncbi:MAG: phage tail tape measure protein [Clostridiales bacterium]|jgi:TP901 family phage tail tape measure protein|nr:phage tail tape measure protein [Clostridiales bacterium]MCI1961754.1 phage tail tape measure protein [Clostridiales bacterium]MCI2021837.1 phage tail tape measure protein [Clostridiales bacterium]MCI2026148.1 phage tail tape measure protein [Clostridiales bacterium]
MAIDLGVAEGHIDLDFSNLQKGVASTVGQLQQLERTGNLTESQLRLMETATKGVGGVFNDAAQKSKRLSAEIEVAKQKTEAYKTGISGLNEIIKKSQTEYDKTGKSIEELSKKYEASKAKVQDAANAHGKESEEYQKAVKASQELNNQLLQEQSRHASLGLEIDGSKAKINEYAAAMNNTQADIQNMERELSVAESKMHAFGVAAEGIGSKMQSAGKAISDVGGKLSLAVTAPLVTAGTAAYKWAESAETSYAKVSTIADSTKLSYDQLKTGITNASNQTGMAVTDLNEALYQSISAGVDSGKAIGFTTDMVKLARGGFTDTAKAVDVVTTVLNAYGLSADNASSISDKLITTQNIGKTTVDELSSSLGRVIPTAKANNVAINDVCTAMAIMTKRGISTAEATTYYNSMLNGLGKSGTAADKALRQMSGEGFSDLVAKGKPVTEILQMLQDYAGKSGKKLSDMFEDVEGGKAALSIMSDSGKEYNEVLQQMANSAGAAQSAADKMDAAPAIKMQKELNKIKNVGIEIGEKLLPYAEKGMSAISDLVDKFDKLSDAQKDAAIKGAGIVAAGGPVLKIFGKMTSGLGTLTSKMGKAAVSATEGKTAADTVAKGAETAAASGLKFVGVLGKIPTPAKLVITTATALGIGIALAMKKAHDAAVSADLAKHFGNVKLSAEECQKVVEHLTKTDWTVKLKMAMDAKNNVDSLEKNLESTIATIEKMNWKVSVGMKLTETEKDSYKQACSDYVKQATDYVESQHYAVSLALQVGFNVNSATYARLSQFSNNLYSSTETELAALGQQLADAINKAFENGTFSKDNPDITKIEKQINDKIKELSDLKYRAKLSNFSWELDTGNWGLDYDSFKKIADEQSKVVEEIQKNADDNQETVNVVIQEEYEANVKEGMSEDVAKKIADDARSETQANVDNQKIDIILKGWNFSAGEVQKAYVDELNSKLPGFQSDTQQWISNLIQSNQNDLQGLSTEFQAEVAQHGSKLSDSAKKAMSDLYTAMAPQKSQLEKVEQDCRNSGREIPQSVIDGLSQINEWGAASGNIDAMWAYLGSQIASSPEQMKALQAASESGGAIPDELAKQIENASGEVYDSTTRTWNKISESSNANAPIVAAELTRLGKTPGDAVADGLSKSYDLTYDEASKTWTAVQKAAEDKAPDAANSNKEAAANATQGTADGIESKSGDVNSAVDNVVKGASNQVSVSTQNLKTAMQNAGIEPTDALINILANKAPEVQLQAINLISQLQTATEDQRPNIIAELNGLGIDVDQALSSGMTDNAGNVSGAAGDTAEGAKNALTGAGLEDTANTVGSNTGSNLAGGISGKSGDVSGSANTIVGAAAQIFTNYGLEALASTIGAGTGSNLAGGLSGEERANKAAANLIADTAQTPISALRGASAAWGSDMGANFAGGISSMWNKVHDAAWSLANTVKGLLHFSRPDYGPMRDYEKWPVDFVNRYAELLKQSSPAIEKQSRAIAERMRDAMTVKPTIDTSTWESVNDVVQGQKLPLKQVLKVQYDKDNANTYKQAITDGILSLKKELTASLMSAAPDVTINNNGNQQMDAAAAAAAFHRQQIKAAHGL